MKSLRTIGLLFCITIATFAFSARAGEFDKLTVFTFNAPVEVPGNIILPPGTYVFRLGDSLADRNVVQIFDEQQSTIYATILTISVERPEPTYKTIVEFYETDGGRKTRSKPGFILEISSDNNSYIPKSARLNSRKLKSNASS